MMKSNEQGKSQALSATRARDWRKAMSDHVAYGLLAYTALQIFVTVKALSEGTSSLLPYLALVVLVAGIIPVCRWFEKRWAVLSDAEAADPEYAPAFKRDVMTLWALAIELCLLLLIVLPPSSHLIFGTNTFPPIYALLVLLVAASVVVLPALP